MFKGFKTVILGVVVGILGTIKAIATPEDAANVPTAEGASAAWDGLQLAYAWGSAVAIWVIRAVTNSPIFNKPPSGPSPTPPAE
jgi:hypothetical protein